MLKYPKESVHDGQGLWVGHFRALNITNWTVTTLEQWVSSTKFQNFTSASGIKTF